MKKHGCAVALALTCWLAPAAAGGELNSFCRFMGFGWSDGYHARSACGGCCGYGGSVAWDVPVWNTSPRAPYAPTPIPTPAPFTPAVWSNPWNTPAPGPHGGPAIRYGAPLVSFPPPTPIAPPPAPTPARPPQESVLVR